MTRCLTALVALAVLSGPALAADPSATLPLSAYEMKPRNPPTNCRPTVARWLKQEARHGSKFVNGYEQWGAMLTGTILWDNGVTEEIHVGPHNGQICVLAGQFVSRTQTRADVR